MAVRYEVTSMTDKLPDRTKPPRYYRLDKVTNQYIETTEDDPERIVYQDELPEMMIKKEAKVLGVVGALILGAWLLRKR